MFYEDSMILALNHDKNIKRLKPVTFQYINGKIYTKILPDII